MTEVFKRNLVPGLKESVRRSAACWKQSLDWNVLQDMVKDKQANLYAFEARALPIPAFPDEPARPNCEEKRGRRRGRHACSRTDE